MTKEKSLSLSTKLKFLFAAIGKHLGVISVGIPFYIVGGFIIYIGVTEQYGAGVGAVIFGAIFILIPLGMYAFSLPSSIRYYYEKELTKEFGKHLFGTITNKRIESNTYVHRDEYDREVEHQEAFYFVEYSYQFQGSHEGEFILDNKDFYDKLQVGDDLPIQVLTVKPSVAEPRLIKLGKRYGLKPAESY
ncbi:hypothetical protein CBQ28_23315 [Pseudoalteromonas sp. GCY]|uniref:hypothetical protein n=1 Tax=Pseudoalteromonas sp. GCY TaxID=2003316 RepID=UPI000BFEFC81|nr:hypothetical protein [Pseudoalteromonas sp. GCY]PHI34706.1 hypothetical protein CBQ28_23315 [Pseudoalteromonas sp. GCY]QQQ68024.1 hypothetical protein JJQ94_09550 [Pseudoalteromonas sp. GCY]